MFQLPSQDVDAMTLEQFRGQVVLVNFWASWCAPCREEMPELQKMQNAYGGDGFQVVGINIDKERENALDFIRDHRIDFTVLFDPEHQVIARFDAKAMPCSYLLDRAGVIRRVFRGYSAAKRDAIENAIAELVRAPAVDSVARTH